MKPAFLLVLAAMLAAWPACGADTGTSAERQFSVRGMGFRANRRLRQTVRILADDDRNHGLFGALFIEDTAMILLDHLTGEGYLDPRVRVKAAKADGSVAVFEWKGTFESKVPRSATFVNVRFTLVPGRRYYYGGIGIAGLRDDERAELLSPAEAESYFFADGILYRSYRRRVFTPERFRQSMRNLREELRRRGFRDAEVTGWVNARDPESGEVRVAVNVDAGRRYLARRLAVRILDNGEGEGEPVEDVETVLQPWTRFWEQDTLLRVRNRFYERGYADVQCVLEIERIEDAEDGRFADITVVVRAGSPLRVGLIQFEGRQHTRLSALRRRLALREGHLLNPLAVEQSRQRLALMGSFDSVTAVYRDAADGFRDVVFGVKEGKRLEISLLAGYGSYELLRGGLEVEQFNLWGRGHRSRLLLAQSFKSTEADYLYSIPELLGERVSGFSRVAALRRQEIDFLRREAGAEAGIRRYFPELAMDASFRYSYTFLRSRRFDAVSAIGIPDAEVGALSADVRHDRRDNPVSPGRGGYVSTRIELAAEALGGNAEYVMWDVGGSLHRRIGGGRIWHGGIHHGVVKALGDEVEKLPFNKRFFPGGDRSLRGYRYGQAASLNADGQLIGSEFLGLLQNEIEQALSPALSLVVFADMLQIGASLADYPHGDLLISAGAGLRYQTIVGPLRLEYGHNLRRRDADPRGAVHLSVGFPF